MRRVLAAAAAWVLACLTLPPAPPHPGAERAGATFTDVAASVRLEFTHVTGAAGEFHFPEIMGSGGALADFDGDGDLDVFLVQGKGPKKAADAPVSRLFRNELIGPGGKPGKLVFEDVTDGSGAAVSAYAMGVATGDYDNDGDIDLYVTCFGPDILLRNDGEGKFTDVTVTSRLGDPRWTTSAVFLDYDGDGLLDLFVAAYADFTLATHKACFTPSGERDYCTPKAYPAIPDRLYRNRGDGTFEDVTGATGIDAAYGHGLGVVAADFDDDGRQDLFVANDGDMNQLWMNRGKRFEDVALLSGAALNERGMTEAGMGIAAGDYDDDGDLDLLVTHLNGETNTLWENRGKAVFEDVTARRGLGQSSLPFTGFGVGWLDADQDGDLDLFVANGDVTRLEGLAGEPYPYHQTNQYIVRGADGRFEDRSAAAGEAMKLSEVSRGAAFGDIDNDGDLDVLVTNNRGPARLLLARPDRPGAWAGLRILDGPRKRDAFGALVRLTLSDGRVLTRPVSTAGSYLSAGDPRVLFSWPEGLRPRALKVIMPDGRSVDLPAPAAGRTTTLTP